MNLKEITEWVAIEKVYRPILATELTQNDLMAELANLWDDGKISSLFEGKGVVLSCDLAEIFDERDSFNDWIIENNIDGYFAEVRIPVREYRDEVSASFSFGYCHCDFIYYQSDKELLKKLYCRKEYWDKYDKKKFLK